MERSVGRVCVSCTVLILSLQVCLAAITVTVLPDVYSMKEERVELPCSFTGVNTSSLTFVHWFVSQDSAATRKRVAYWSKSGAGVDEDSPMKSRVSMLETFSLVINPVSVADNKSFFCQVTNSAGAQEAETRLHVFYVPEIPVATVNAQAISANLDKSAEVGTCMSKNGFPEPRIIWFKDSVPLSNNPVGKNSTYMVPKVVKEASGLFTVSSTLFMHLTKADSSAVFHCTVEHGMPNKEMRQQNSNKFNVTLLYPSEHAFFKLLNQNPIKEGDDVQMKCETDGNPQPSFDFEKDGKEVSSNIAILTLKNVTRNHSGKYNCKAFDFDTFVELEAHGMLEVKYLDPVSVTPAGPLIVKKGGTVELQCKTNSSEIYTQSWLKDNQQLSQKTGLTLETVTLADAGNYVCLASVPTVPGLVKQANISIIVTGKPEIEKPINGEVKKEGDQITLKCSAMGYPAPQFTWKPSGKESMKIEGTKYISEITLPATAEVLKSGVTCEASNSDGHNSVMFKVGIKSDNMINPSNTGRADTQQGGSSGVVIAVVVCVLLLLLLVAFLYFLSKKGKMSCGKKEKKEVGSGAKSSDIVVEMKPGENGNEDAVPLNKTPADH